MRVSRETINTKQKNREKTNKIQIYDRLLV